jgi:hypothetical protein
MMAFKRKLLFGGILFSWLMVFLSWRFAYGIEIIVDWVLVALALSAVYGFLLYRSKARKFIEDPEALR